MSHCKGCVSSTTVDICSFKIFNARGQCPCSECLVKVTCISGCKDYSYFTSDTVIKEDWSKRRRTGEL